MREILGDQLPKFSEEDIKLLRNSVDFLGLNQYTTRFIAHAKESAEECHFYKVQGIERIGIILRTDFSVNVLTACFFLMVMLLTCRNMGRRGSYWRKGSSVSLSLCHCCQVLGKLRNPCQILAFGWHSYIILLL